MARTNSLMLIRKSHRLLSWTSAALAAWLALAGCDDPGNEPPAPSQASSSDAAVPVPVRVVVVTMFERGAD
ncbi:MAG: hypothetical protein F4X31_07675, partial [Gammaproteobacteria bacterium]|nr:hypothetical protein [Gammaproteobacteria bacterium]